MNFPLAFDFALNPVQMMILGAIAVLLFGKRLPEVGRSLGKGIAELRKGIRGIEDVIQDAGKPLDTTDHSPELSYQHPADDHDEATAPKFEPPPQPKTESAEIQSK